VHAARREPTDSARREPAKPTASISKQTANSKHQQADAPTRSMSTHVNHAGLGASLADSQVRVCVTCGSSCAARRCVLCALCRSCRAVGCPLCHKFRACTCACRISVSHVTSPPCAGARHCGGAPRWRSRHEERCTGETVCAHGLALLCCRSVVCAQTSCAACVVCANTGEDECVCVRCAHQWQAWGQTRKVQIDLHLRGLRECSPPYLTADEVSACADLNYLATESTVIMQPSDDEATGSPIFWAIAFAQHVAASRPEGWRTSEREAAEMWSMDVMHERLARAAGCTHMCAEKGDVQTCVGAYKDTQRIVAGRKRRATRVDSLGPDPERLKKLRFLHDMLLLAKTRGLDQAVLQMQLPVVDAPPRYHARLTRCELLVQRWEQAKVKSEARLRHAASIRKAGILGAARAAGILDVARAATSLPPMTPPPSAPPTPVPSDSPPTDTDDELQEWVDALASDADDVPCPEEVRTAPRDAMFAPSTAQQDDGVLRDACLASQPELSTGSATSTSTALPGANGSQHLTTAPASSGKYRNVATWRAHKAKLREEKAREEAKAQRVAAKKAAQRAAKLAAQRVCDDEFLAHLDDLDAQHECEVARKLARAEKQRRLRRVIAVIDEARPLRLVIRKQMPPIRITKKALAIARELSAAGQ